jgi:ubiquinone/menaquinone biosynthesis C-methylase UbiE
VSSSWTTEYIRSVYEDRALTYDRDLWIFEMLFLRRLRRRLVSRARGRVLEVGIGTGINLPYYDATCALFGVDLSRPMLERAVNRAHDLGRQLMVDVMDAEALSVPDQSFDTVLSTFTLCTTPDPVQLLREMARACRAGGRVLLLEHGLGTDIPVNQILTHFAPGHLLRNACHLTRDVAAFPEQAGLRVLEKRRHLFGTFTVIEAAPTWERRA